MCLSAMTPALCSILATTVKAVGHGGAVQAPAGAATVSTVDGRLLT